MVHNSIFRRFLFLVLALALVAGFLIASTQSTAASPQYGELQWRIQARFTNGEPQLSLVVLIDRFEGDDIREVIPLECGVFGDVDFDNGAAIFGGNGFIGCDVPSIMKLAEELTEGELVLGDRCDCKEAWVNANLEFDNNPASNPVFFHPDVQFAAPLTAPREALLALAVDGLAAESDRFLTSLASNNLWATLTEADPDLFEPQFAANGKGLVATPPVVPGDPDITNGASTIYVGYSPATGELFEGILYSLDVDPGCRGIAE